MHPLSTRHINRGLRHHLACLQTTLPPRLIVAHWRHSLHRLPPQLVHSFLSQTPADFPFVLTRFAGMRIPPAARSARDVPWDGPRRKATLQWEHGLRTIVSILLRVCQERTLPLVMKMKFASRALPGPTPPPALQPPAPLAPRYTPRRRQAARLLLHACQ